MKDNMDRSLFFLTLSLVCVWLLVDMAIGKNYLTNFLSILFPFMENNSGNTMTREQIKEATENAPSGSAIGGNKKPTGETSGLSSSAINGGNGSSYGVRSR